MKIEKVYYLDRADILQLIIQKLDLMEKDLSHVRILFETDHNEQFSGIKLTVVEEENNNDIPLS